MCQQRVLGPPCPFTGPSGLLLTLPETAGLPDTDIASFQAVTKTSLCKGFLKYIYPEVFSSPSALQGQFFGAATIQFSLCLTDRREVSWLEASVTKSAFREDERKT